MKGDLRMPKTMGSLMEVARIQSEINRLFDNLLDLGADDGPGGAWMPNTDISETADTLELRIELPGVSAHSLTVTVHGGQVVLQGEKKSPGLGTEATTQTSERVFGTFRRTIHLGVPVNTRRAAGVLHNGLLRITFPKVPNRRGETVRIEVQQQ